MSRFQSDVAESLRKFNSDRLVLLINFEEQVVKWEMLSQKVGKVKGFSLLQSVRLCYAFNMTVITSKRFLEYGISPQYVSIGKFDGAAVFFKSENILFWRIDGSPAQYLVNAFCSLEESKFKVVRPALVLFTALLTTFLGYFPFGERLSPKFGLKYLISGTGIAEGDEELDTDTIETTFRHNGIPVPPVLEEEEESENIGDIFSTSDERSDLEDDELY